jgi:predicted RNA-binding Zn ribbon-like protein
MSLVTLDPDSPSRNRQELALRSVNPVSERQPGDRPPAPGDISLVQAFCNTFWDLDRRGQEQLVSAAALAEWLVKHDLLEAGTRLDQGDFERALDVREGLRALLLVNNGAAANQEAIDRLNRVLDRPGLSLQLSPLALPDFRAQFRNFDAALALIATIAAVAQLDDRWSRLKACRGEHCGWVFYDHSRNQVGSWCAMSACGSRAKAREYRHRKRQSRRS